MRRKKAVCSGSSPWIGMIPHDVLDVQILPRLPIKSLIRFKSVDRYWNSVISSYEFAKNYLKSQQIDNIPSLVIQTQQDRLDVLSEFFALKLTKLEPNEQDNHEVHDTGFNLSLSRLEHGYEPPNYATSMVEKMIGSSNGLICIQITSRDYIDLRRCGHVTSFLMWNPLINLRRTIKGPYILFQSRIMSSGFGYSSSSDDYKIVVLTEVLNKPGVVIHLFSSRRSTWTKLSSNSFSFHYTARVFGQPVLVNDSLYWLFKDEPNVFKLAAFELNTESLSLVPLHNSISVVPNDLVSQFLCEIEQRLCVCLIKSSSNTNINDGFVDLEVWMVQDSWTQLFHLRKLDKSVLKYIIYLSSPTLLGRDEDKVLCLGVCQKQLVSIHKTSGENGKYRAKYTHILDDHKSNLSCSFSYVKSLISPYFNGGRVPLKRKAKMCLC